MSWDVRHILTLALKHIPARLRDRQRFAAVLNVLVGDYALKTLDYLTWAPDADEAGHHHGPWDTLGKELGEPGDTGDMPEAYLYGLQEIWEVLKDLRDKRLFDGVGEQIRQLGEQVGEPLVDFRISPSSPIHEDPDALKAAIRLKAAVNIHRSTRPWLQRMVSLATGAETVYVGGARSAVWLSYASPADWALPPDMIVIYLTRAVPPRTEVRLIPLTDPGSADAAIYTADVWPDGSVIPGTGYPLPGCYT